MRLNFEAIGEQLPNLDVADVTYEGFMDTANGLKELSAVCQQLATYAEIRGIAHAARLYDNIPRAIELETHSQRIYNKLPQWAKW